MSRQFDEHMADKFELYGEFHSLIEPSNFEELMKAIQVRDVIQTAISGLMHDEDSSEWGDLLQTQEDYIQGYLDSLGGFDNSFLVSNINYLAKKDNLRIGDLEKLLGISAGYISRTAKENSAKKLSIDVVWKIAKLFETDFSALLETDIQIPNTNTEMAAKFLQKVYKQTEEGTIEWINNGGVECELDDSINAVGLVTEEDESYYSCPAQPVNAGIRGIPPRKHALKSSILHPTPPAGCRYSLRCPLRQDYWGSVHAAFGTLADI